MKSILITEQQISDRIHDLGEQISRDYLGKDLILVGILKGAFIFLADLSRNISIPLSIDFVALSSYGSSTVSTGKVIIEKSLGTDITGKHILLVEDIVDTGYTLGISNLIENLYSAKAASVKICTLLDKPSRRKINVQLDYVGFQILDEFVVGYGLDYDSLYRNLPYIGILNQIG
ncbi:MAG: hypoxanthine phosphoribosyltransferase [Armatimonadota bacterium]